MAEDFNKKVTLIEIEVDNKSAIASVDKLTDSILDQKDAIKDNSTEVKELEKANADLGKQVKEGTITQDKAAKKTEENKGKIKELNKVNANLRDGVKDLNKERTQAVKVSKLQSNSLDALRAKVISQKKELNSLNTETEAGSKRFQELSKELKANNEAITKADQSAGDFKTTIGKYKEETGKALDSTDALTGGMVSAGKGFLGMAKKALVFLATPIGAIIGLLAFAILSVKAAFQGSEEGQNKFNKLTAIIGVTIGNLVDILADVGEFIIEAFENPQQAIEDFANLIKDNIITRFEGLTELIPQLGKAITALFAGNFAEAGEIAANAMGKVVLGVEDVVGKVTEAAKATKDFFDQTVAESNQAAKVADMRAKADLIARKLLVDRARLETEISALKLKSRQEDQFGAEIRKKALLDAQALEDTLLKREQEVLSLRSKAITIENTFSRSNKENLDAEAQAKADLLQIESKRLDQQRTTQRELNRLNKEIAADDKRIAKEREKTQEELDKALLDLAEFRREQENERKLEAAATDEEEFQLKLEQQQERFDIEQELLAEENEIALENKELSNEEELLLKTEFDLAKEELEAGHLDAIAKINNDADKAKVKADKKSDKDEIDRAKKKQKTLRDIINTGLDLIQAFTDASFATRNSKITAQNDEETKVLENQLENGQITLQRFDFLKEQLDRNSARKAHRLQVKEFRANKVLSLLEIGISTALAIAKSLPNIPASIAVGALGAAQAVIVASSRPPSPPSFAQGGDVFGFVSKGKSHAIGGETWRNDSGGSFNIQGDEGVFITKREATNPALALLSSVNESFGGRSMFGAPKQFLQEGGVATATAQALSAEEINDIVAAIPNPQVQVVDIMAGIQGNVEAKETGVV